MSPSQISDMCNQVTATTLDEVRAIMTVDEEFTATPSSPISLLPPELLSIILTLVVRSYHSPPLPGSTSSSPSSPSQAALTSPTPTKLLSPYIPTPYPTLIALTLVSRLWRSTALACQPFWAAAFQLPAISSPRSRRFSDLQAKMIQTRIEKTQTDSMLQRIGEAPLTLRLCSEIFHLLRSEPWLRTSLRRMFDPERLEAFHFKSTFRPTLEVGIDIASWPGLRPSDDHTGRICFPKLHTIDLHSISNPTDVSATLLNTLLTSEKPALRVLSLDACRVPWAAFLPAPTSADEATPAVLTHDQPISPHFPQALISLTLKRFFHPRPPLPTFLALIAASRSTLRHLELEYALPQEMYYASFASPEIFQLASSARAALPDVSSGGMQDDSSSAWGPIHLPMLETMVARCNILAINNLLKCISLPTTTAATTTSKHPLPRPATDVTFHVDVPSLISSLSADICEQEEEREGLIRGLVRWCIRRSGEDVDGDRARVRVRLDSEHNSSSNVLNLRIGDERVGKLAIEFSPAVPVGMVSGALEGLAVEYVEY
ncbi:hypothetical protein BDV98DRAFT_659697 [Pterulicium gracile]|uniref:F-box domain-containing protein n=1 Tax=Pterulicium gracile TaxID=1884261 RepID=A0A5C3Q172_9AGAR|nr:hypothetical protein BDV98DRAFT_659697 [Pterula gracilis]